MAKQKEEILFEWAKPKEASVLDAKAKFKRGKTMFPRVFIIIGIVWGVLYFVLDYLFPPDSGFNFGRLFIVGFVYASLMLMILYFGIPIADKFSRTKYQITPERVRIFISRSDSRAIRWKDIIGYKVCKYEELEGFVVVRFFYRKGRFCASMFLPKDDRAADITNYIAQRIPVLETLPLNLEIIKLKDSQKLCLGIAIVAYSVVMAWLIGFCEAKWLVKFVPAIFVVGPGFVCFLIMFGKRFIKNNRLRALAILCNLITVFLTMFLSILLSLYRLKQEIVGW
jgi:hypothetical protein